MLFDNEVGENGTKVDVLLFLKRKGQILQATFNVPKGCCWRR